MEEYSKRWNKMNDEIDKALPEGEKSYVLYSAYKTDEDGLPVNNLHEVAVKGKAIFVGLYDSFWGKGKDYQSEVMENPTWLDVAVAANKMIQVTGDYHHVFLEDVYKTNYEIDGVPVYYLSMGS